MGPVRKRGCDAVLLRTRTQFGGEARAFPGPTWLAAEALFWRELFLVQINENAGENGDALQAVWNWASF